MADSFSENKLFSADLINENKLFTADSFGENKTFSTDSFGENKTFTADSVSIKNVTLDKVAMIVICETPEDAQAQNQFFAAHQVYLPEQFQGMKFDYYVAIKEEAWAKTFNQIQREINAKYKIYITTPVKIFNPSIVVSILTPFLWNSNFGMLGLYGSEMPFTGDYKSAKNIYGRYSYINAEDEIKNYEGKTPLLYQNVTMIDSGIFATSQDIPFDEDISDEFLMAAQCCRCRRAGYDIGVAYAEFLNNGGFAFVKDRCLYNPADDAEDYQAKLKIFTERYKDIVTPLISVCIPTYNQPTFCEKAMKSALEQTYPNVEVIIGDDSTNEDTKEMIQPYLEKYDNVKYFYHGGPLGDKGGKNTTFVINKASGEYINVLFHDDLLAKNKFECMMTYFTRDLENQIALTMSARLAIDKDDKVISRMNEWQPLEDAILSGEEVCRKLLFASGNFLGELSTGLLRRKDLVTKDAVTGEKIFDIGVFCGVKDVAFFDVGTWLNLLQSNKHCVYISEPLSAFRRHDAQNTYDPFIQLRMVVELMSYITISWLNNLFLHDYEEYKTVCKSWLLFFDMHYTEDAGESDDIKFLMREIKKVRDFVIEDKFSEVLDGSIKILLEMLPEKNSVLPLITKNEDTGLWEKADDGINLHGRQRC